MTRNETKEFRAAISEGKRDGKNAAGMKRFASQWLQNAYNSAYLIERGRNIRLSMGLRVSM